MKNLFLIAALALIPWAANAQNSNMRQTASVLGIGVAGRVDPDSVTAR